jgi:hypothetical protein
MTNIVATTTSVFAAISSVIGILDPAAAGVIDIVAKVLAGVSAAEPTAVSLYQSLTSSVPPTAEQLQAYAASYEAAYQKLNTDLGEAQ